MKKVFIAAIALTAISFTGFAQTKQPASNKKPAAITVAPGKAATAMPATKPAAENKKPLMEAKKTVAPSAKKH